MEGLHFFFTSKYFIASLIIIGLAIFGWIVLTKFKKKWTDKDSEKKKIHLHL